MTASTPALLTQEQLRESSIAWLHALADPHDDSIDPVHKSYASALLQHIAALTQRVEAAEADARRYRWLRDESTSYEDHPFIALRRQRAVTRWNGQDADAAIDAAMAPNDWLTREARQIGLHSPACASVRFGQNECDCGVKP